MLNQVHDREEMEELLYGDAIIFKHSSVCPMSAKAFDTVKEFVEETGIDIHYLIVQAQRELSNMVEEKTGVEHECPQIINLHDGEVIWHASHYDVTKQELEKHINH